MLIIRLAGLAPCRCRPLSSNVRRTQIQVFMCCPPQVLTHAKHCRSGRAVSLPVPAGAGSHGLLHGFAARFKYPEARSWTGIRSRASSPAHPHAAGVGRNSFALVSKANGALASVSRQASNAALHSFRTARPQGTPNPSLKRSTVGRAPGPRGRHAYHRPRGHGALPPLPA